MHHRRVPDRDAQHLHVCRAKKPDSLQHCTTTSKQARTQLQLHSVLASVISASDSPDKCTLENVVNQAEETKFLECELKRGKEKPEKFLRTLTISAGILIYSILALIMPADPELLKRHTHKLYSPWDAMILPSPKMRHRCRRICLYPVT